jgi:hypothetical protein
MKKSEKIFIIGKKPTKLYIFASAMVPLFFTLLFGGFALNYFKLGFCSFGFIAIAYLLLLLLYIPIILNFRQYWDIREGYLEYYGITDYFQQLKYVLSIFNGNDDMFAFKIKLTEINSIRLYWTSTWTIASTPDHFIYFGITLKDGSIINYRSLISSFTKEYIEAVNYLKEKCNIQIEDTYNLLDALADPCIDLAKYIDKIEKQEDKWRTKNGQS